MKNSVLILIFFITISTSWAQNKSNDFTVTDIYGIRHTLSEYQAQGKSVFLDFFTTSCVSCQVLSPIIDTVFRAFGCNCDNIVFLGINKFADDESVYDFTQEFGMSFPVASGIEGNGNEVFNIFNVNYTPYKILIDAANKILIDNMNIGQSTDLIDTLHYYGYTENICSCKEILRYSVNINTFEIFGIIDAGEKNITLELPEATNLNAIVSNFVISANSQASVNEIVQESGITTNDFSGGSLPYKITAADGSFSTWTVIVQTTSEFQLPTLSQISVYPNPISSNSVLQIHSNQSINTNFELFDVSGKKISGKQILLHSGFNRIMFSDMFSKLHKGFFILKIRTGTDYFIKIVF